MTEKQNLEKKAEEEYRAWVNDRHHPGLQDDVWTVLQDILEKNPNDLKTLTRIAYVSRYRSGGYSFAIKFAEKALELRPDNFLIKLFIADTFYEWGLDIQDKEKLKKAFDQYDRIFQENPNFAYFHHITDRKLECNKKLWR
jgi:tetratricopeptide (TPR) repeat protein